MKPMTLSLCGWLDVEFKENRTIEFKNNFEVTINPLSIDKIFPSEPVVDGGYGVPIIELSEQDYALKHGKGKKTYCVLNKDYESLVQEWIEALS